MGDSRHWPRKPWPPSRAETASPRLLGDLAVLYLGLKRYAEAEEAFRAPGATRSRARAPGAARAHPLPHQARGLARGPGRGARPPRASTASTSPTALPGLRQGPAVPTGARRGAARGRARASASSRSCASTTSCTAKTRPWRRREEEYTPVAEVPLAAATEASAGGRLAAMPANRWAKCPQCAAFVYFKRLEKNLKVCPECTHHFRLSARERVGFLLDPGSFQELDADLSPGRPARLRRLAALPRRASRRTGASPASHEAAIYGTGTIGGYPVVICALDFTFLGGSMGSVVGEKVTRAVELGGEDAHARDRLLLLRRRAHAGGHPLPDADGQDVRRAGRAGRGGRALLLAADRPDVRRRERLVRHPGRPDHRRAEGDASASPGRRSSSRPSGRSCPRASRPPSS